MIDDDECFGKSSTGITSEDIVSAGKAVVNDHKRTVQNICNIVRLPYGMYFIGRIEHEKDSSKVRVTTN